MRRSTTTLCVLLVAVAGYWVYVDLDSASERSARAASSDEHGGSIVFFVKKNRQNRLHVSFDHKLHLDAGHTCNDCHNDKVFKKTKKLNANSFTMKDVMAGKACGACHDGKTTVRDRVVFAPKDNCERCHSIKLRQSGR